MNKKLIFVTVVIMSVGVFALTRPHKYIIPSDLRDAVTDEIPGKDRTAGEAVYPVPKAAKEDVSVAKAADLTSLINTYLEFKQAMERVELSLMGEYGSSVPTERRLQEALAELQKCREIAKKFHGNAAKAIANTPKNRDTIASSKLLLEDISEVTSDNDIPCPALQYLFDIGKKSPELKRQTKPHNDLMYEVMTELTGGAEEIVKLSGYLP